MKSQYSTVAELAAMLDRVHSMPTSDIQYLLELRDATMRLAYPYPRLEPARHNFASAVNRAEGVSQDSERWSLVKKTAAELAIMVRTIGNIKITLCAKRNKFGQCDVPLTPGGICKSPIPHQS